MALYTTLHLHDVPQGREAEYAKWFDGPHREALARLRDFSGRAGGRSPSRIAMEPRSKSASIARAVHYFRKNSGDAFWSGGVACGGDLSVYRQ